MEILVDPFLIVVIQLESLRQGSKCNLPAAALFGASVATRAALTRHTATNSTQRFLNIAQFPP